MCRDFLRLGYSKMVVDPGVRLAYTADVARQRYTQKVPGSAACLCQSMAPGRQSAWQHANADLLKCSPHLCKARGSRKLHQGIASRLHGSCMVGGKGSWCRIHRSRCTTPDACQERRIQQRP